MKAAHMPSSFRRVVLATLLCACLSPVLATFCGREEYSVREEADGVSVVDVRVPNESRTFRKGPGGVSTVYETNPPQRRDVFSATVNAESGSMRIHRLVHVKGRGWTHLEGSQIMFCLWTEHKRLDPKALRVMAYYTRDDPQAAALVDQIRGRVLKLAPGTPFRLTPPVGRRPRDGDWFPFHGFTVGLQVLKAPVDFGIRLVRVNVARASPEAPDDIVWYFGSAIEPNKEPELWVDPNPIGWRVPNGLKDCDPTLIWNC